jgi:hypothetical protein
LKTCKIGLRVAQVQAIFSIPEAAISKLFSSTSNPTPPKHLAYVEWFSQFPTQPREVHGMYKIKRSYKDGHRHASVIDVKSIYRSAHLIPKFGSSVPREWSSFNVLEECHTFYVNCFTDRHTYLTLCFALTTITFVYTASLSVT